MVAKDDTFELLTRMYVDFTSQFKEMRSDFSELKSRTSKLENSVLKIQLKLENEVDKKLGILLEGQEETNHRLDRLERKVDVLSVKVEKHDLEIMALKADKEKIY